MLPTYTYGLPARPGAYLDFTALRGDPSDELPGVAGIGPKTAATVLGALDGVGRTVADVLAGDATATGVLRPRRDLLVAGDDCYKRNRRLMDAVIDLDVDLAAAAGPLAAGRLQAACDRAGIPTAVTSLTTVAGARLQPATA